MSRLLKTRFECEVITPMFLGDSTGKKAELRIPPFRAEMRFWLRAILGSILNQDSYKTAKIEQLIMGGTIENAQQSNIHMRIIRAENSLQTEDEPMLPHKEGNRVAYKNAILPGNKYSIEIKSFSDDHIIRNKKGKEIGRVKKKDIYDISVSLFKLTSLIGTVGQRSNRGFGSFSIRKLSPQLIEKEVIESTIKQYLNDIKQKIKELIESVEIFENYISDFKLIGVSNWPTLHSDSCRISVGGKIEWSGFIKDLMQNIHRELKIKNLEPKVLGGIKPRQGSTMKISVVKVEKRIIPIFINFITQTKGNPRLTDYENILEFPTKFYNAQVISI